MMLNFVNIGSQEIFGIVLLTTLLLFAAMFLVFKKESGLMKVFWLLLVIMLPIAGSLAYIINYLVSNRKLQKS